MLTYILISMILLASCFFDKKKNKSIVIFAIASALFQLVAPLIPNDIFYIVAPCVGVFVLVLFEISSPPNTNTFIMASICTISVFANIYGWMMYESWHEATIYNGVFIGIYFAVLCLSLREWWCNAGSKRDPNNIGFCGTRI